MLEPLLAPPLGELDDQDRVLGGQADEHDEADLRIDVDLQAAQPQRRQRAEQRQRHREQDHERHRPALVLRRQDEEDEDDARGAKTTVAIEPALSSWKVMPVHSKAKSRGNAVAAARSIAATAWPEL